MMMSKMKSTKDFHLHVNSSSPSSSSSSPSPSKNDKNNKALLTTTTTTTSTCNGNHRDTTDEIISYVEAIVSGAKDDDDDDNGDDTASFASPSVTETAYYAKKDIDHAVDFNVDLNIDVEAQVQVQIQDDYLTEYEVPVVFNKNNKSNHDDDDDDGMAMPTILARETSTGSCLSHCSLNTTHHDITTLSRQVSADNNAITDGDGDGDNKKKKKISNVEAYVQSATKTIHCWKYILIVFISLMGMILTTSIGICVNKFYDDSATTTTTTTATSNTDNNKKLLILPVGVVTALASLFVGVIFVSILILLIFYNRSVEQRQRRLLRQAEQTDAIVSDLYPIDVQRKLMMIDRDNNNNVITSRNIYGNINGNNNNNNKDSLLTSSSSSHHHQEKENAFVPSSSSTTTATSDPTGGKVVAAAASDDQATSKSYPQKDKHNNFQHHDTMIIAGTNHTSSTTNTTTPSSSLRLRNTFRRDWWSSTTSLSSVPQRMLSLASSSTSISGLTSVLGTSSRPIPLDDDDDGIDTLLSRYGNTEPIADFYPNTTIMMCDLAGFTAWSSQRSPSDVFRLLETIYGAFDDIARAENVFKVETVGDCYVACAGLPQKVSGMSLLLLLLLILMRNDVLYALFWIEHGL
jgi:hypothetical protein